MLSPLWPCLSLDPTFCRDYLGYHRHVEAKPPGTSVARTPEVPLRPRRAFLDNQEENLEAIPLKGLPVPILVSWGKGPATPASKIAATRAVGISSK